MFEVKQITSHLIDLKKLSQPNPTVLFSWFQGVLKAWSSLSKAWSKTLNVLCLLLFSSFSTSVPQTWKKS